MSLRLTKALVTEPEWWAAVLGTGLDHSQSCPPRLIERWRLSAATWLVPINDWMRDRPANRWR
jgi:hypothetical protein